MGKITGTFDRLQRFVEPCDPQPSAEFETAVREFGQVGIPHFLVKTEGIRIFRGNNGVNCPISLSAQDLFQRQKERFSDAFSPCLGQKIHGILRNPAKCRKGADEA